MDRAKAIKVLKPLVDSYVDYANITMKEEDDDIVEALEMAVEALKREMQPERKRGEWIVWGGMDIPENHGRHICSLCGEFAPVRCEKPLIKEYLSDFCPSCGADMRGEENG